VGSKVSVNGKPSEMHRLKSKATSSKSRLKCTLLHSQEWLCYWPIWAVAGAGGLREN
jgi:hypothetical protein